ncbi:Gramicidin S synthase 2 [Paenibacillus plantiphilus]|uniref:Gramicidin S synthase 2 n=1 Tax=Paenibacillus plantiphilus TaxID=2905650 RepID=A0ABN8GDY3_9BACL|nr:non-ribosomal peptide synthetase [Paenibacillus plantiphilus]CAH1206501.1 Gramicidin S synthase 2 [Paenibacillus plantiphilus]
MKQKQGIQNIYTLTPMQQGMLFHSLLDEQSSSYLTQTSFEIKGDFNVSIFTEAFNHLIQRHDILRTVFHFDKAEKPLQIVLTKRKLNVPYTDISELDEHIQKEYLNDYKLRDSQFMFDLKKDLLVRIAVFKTAQESYHVVWTHHHILMDGWCLTTLSSEVFTIYEALKNGSEVSLPPVTSYSTYIKWMSERNSEESSVFWKAYLSNYDESISLPKYRDKSMYKDHGYRKNSKKRLVLDEEISKQLLDVAHHVDVTLNVVIQGIWGMLLQKYNNCSDVVFGTVVSGRPPHIPGIEQMVGLFINTIPVRIQADETTRIQELFKKLQEKSLLAVDHHYHPLFEIQANSEVKQGLFDHIMAFENYPIGEEIEKNARNGLGFQIYNFQHDEETNYDFNITVTPGSSIAIEFIYNPAVFDEGMLDRLQGHVRQLIHAVVNEQDALVKDIVLLTNDEINLYMNKFNDTKAEYPSDRTVHSLFEEQVRKTPDHVAVVHEEERLTYAELNARANRLAHALREQGVGPDEIVGLLMECSVDMIVGILGILKAGGAYLPIDPDYPAERIRYMFEDSGIRVLLVEEGTSKVAARCGGTVLLLHAMNLEGYPDTNPEVCSDADAEQLVYVIYTSGSTGRPKGVMVEHRGAANALQWRSEAYHLGEDDCVLQLFSFAFDGFVTSFFTGIVSGASVVLLGANEARNPVVIKQAIAKNGVTHFICVPSLYGAILDELTAEEARMLRVVTLAGERVTSNIVEKSLAVSGTLELVNEYGPTENSVVTTYYRHMERAERPLIGKPVANQHVYIVDRAGKLQPLGVPGELCIGGAGLARGYLNNQELTAERFVANPFVPGERLYKTGDWARWLPDGNIEYLGRIDEQVKIRGYRIELGEIEAAILQEPSVREAAVMAKEDRDGSLFLCAYIAAAAGKEGEAAAEVKASLQRKLPAYMVPSSFVALEKLPLTANGKLDRKALPEPEQGLAGVSYEAPSTAMEAGLAKLWEDILGVERIGAADNFFDRGGHSLRAMTLLSRMHKEWNVQMPLKTIFESPTLRGLAQAIEGLAENPYAAIEPVERRAYYPVSPAQRRMLILQQLEGAEVSYNMPGVLTMAGPLDRSRLETAFARLVARHESLRTSFEWVDGEPVQRVHEAIPFTIFWESCSEGEVASRVEAFIRPFDLETAPLLRVGLLRLAEERHVLLYDMHHIISDGVSMGVLEQEFAALYRGDDLTPLRIQYKDYAVWQNERLGAEELAKQEDYWKDVFSGELPVLAMPTDHARPAVRSFEGDGIGFTVEAELVERLRQVGADQGATLYMVLLAAYTALLSKYTGQVDIVVGTPVAGRPHADLEQMIGMFVGTLALRNYPSGEKRFAAFVEEVKQRVLQAFAHQDYPFEELVEKLDLARDRSRNPLFDTMFVLQNLERQEAELEGLLLSPYAAGNGVAKFDLTLTAEEGAAGLYFTLDYSTALYEQKTMERLAGHFSRLLEQLAANPNMKLADIELLDEAEKTQLLERFNDTGASYPSDRTIHSLFEEQVRKTPDHVAVIHEEDRLTYAELNARANRLAHTLREQGVGPDEIVGLMLERSVDMIVGILGILKAGGAYLPIDPDYPAERICYILGDSEARLLVTAERWKEKAGGHAIGTVLLDDERMYAGVENGELEEVNGPTDLAYVIYTSGSTGKPKGAMIEHRSVINRLKWMQEKYPLRADDVILQKTPYTFDVSVWELLWWSLEGAKVCLLKPGGEKDPGLIADTIAAHGITVMHAVPSMLNAFLEYVESVTGSLEKTVSLRQVFASGEALKVEQAKRFGRMIGGAQLSNLYGPTEATVDVTSFDCDMDELERMCIGKPIYNTSLYIVDRVGKLQPLGVPGELCIGGVGLARGYLNRPELTAEKFVANPFVPGERLYKTGDWARWLPDGNIEYLGRIDEQVKIRGYRIELGEIEAAILQEPTVREAAVMAKEDRDGSLYLCAYIAAAAGKEGEAAAEVKASLQRKLPVYMVPSYFVSLEKLPLTVNGKLDRKALPEPEQGLAGEPYEAPSTVMEAQLAKLWADILGVERIGAADNFFDRGGHSLRAMTLLSRIHKEWNVQVPLKAIFESPTVRGLAQAIEGLDENPYAAIEPVEGRSHYPVSPAQRRMLILQQLEGAEVSYNIPGVLMMEGPLDRSRLETVFARMVERHESLRTSFEWVDGEPMQRVHEAVPLTIFCESCSEEEVASQVEAFIRPFDLETAPLLRVGLLHLSEERHVLLYDMHHIISDGVSMTVLVKEFTNLYDRNERIPLRIQYKDYAVWQNILLASGEMVNQEMYWMSVFSDEIPVLAMPTDFPRSVVPSFAGGQISFSIDEELTEKLRRLAFENSATLYMVLLAAYTALLSKYTGQEDIIVGTPIASRSHADLENMIGMLTNTLAMRNYPASGKSFSEFLAEVKENALKAYTNQDFPFDRLIEKIDHSRGLSRNPLFDVMFALQNTEDNGIEIDLLKVTVMNYEVEKAKFELELGGIESSKEIEFILKYRSGLYLRKTMELFTQRFISMLEQIVKEPFKALCEMDVFGREEIEHLSHGREELSVLFDF